LLAYAQQYQLSTLASMTLNRLAILALQQSYDKPQVYALLEEALQMAQTSADQRALAVLSAWEGHREQAIGHLREAAGLAADMGLPAEQWQIQAALGALYEAGGEPAQAHTAFAEASRIIQELAEGITDEARRARFLAGPQIHPVLQHAQSEVSRFRQTRRSRAGVEVPDAAGSSRGLSAPLSSSLQERASPPAHVSHSPAFQALSMTLS
jgi:tetratricopeptide (TPR) repeat protein